MNEREHAYRSIEEPLRNDIRMLGEMLGDVLREQCGDELFERVEGARTAAIGRRRGDAGAGNELAALLADLDLHTARDVVRAFSAYFQLVNMAERVHRIRRRRDYLKTGSQPQPGSLLAVMGSLRERECSRSQVEATLELMQITPVLTAHPTEAVRRTMLSKEQRVARLLVDRIERPDMTRHEAESIRERLYNEITLGWQTEEHLATRPTVAEEAEHTLFYLSDVVYRVIPALYDALAQALDEAYPGETGDHRPPRPIVRFGTWVGGDMDGNPNVNATTIIETLERQRRLVIDRYRAELRTLFDHLSQSRSRVGVSPEVIERCERYEALLPDAAASIPARYGEMPYRRLVWLMWSRLQATVEEDPAGYDSAEEFEADLECIARSLREHAGERAGLSLVERLDHRVRTFGFHLATLDVRQHAGALRDTADRATLDVFRAMADARRRFGSRAIGPFIISMARGPEDVLAVLRLARAAGMAASEEDPVAVDVAPLFETVDDLERAGAALRDLVENPVYHEHLRSRGNRQFVMIGYSDSSKLAGLAASRWALHRAQEELVTVADANGLDLTLFHGRGGTIGRGGSKPREAVLAAPAGAVRSRLRVTEQGELINAKYGLRGIAERTLEVTTGAVLEASLSGSADQAVEEGWRDAMDTIAETSRRSYQELMRDDSDLVTYFRHATPIDVIERMRIGSRPASRKHGGGLEDLRAIPWVFAWTQSRHLVPGWFGVGSGLAAAVARHGRSVLGEMAEGWPLVATMLADVEMVLAKADMDIASHYARLAGVVGDRVYPRIREEYERTREHVLALNGGDEPLDREPVLQQAIRLRNPYVDPMSLVQVDLLRRWRAGGRRDESIARELFETVRGIARGMQNTG